jgi:hypothetical protein
MNNLKLLLFAEKDMTLKNIISRIKCWNYGIYA